MENRLIRSVSPHIKAGTTKQKLMLLVIAALMPAAGWGIYIFGKSAAMIIGTCIIAAIITDILMQKLTSQKFGIINPSSLLTGLLLAMVLPPTVPLWCAALGSAIAVALGKYAFGIGNNIFNPALVGRAFLIISWPSLTSGWVNPDGVTAATPLSAAKAEGLSSAISSYPISSLFFGNTGGCIGETSALLILAGGIFLILTRVIEWRIPAVFIGSVFLGSAFSGTDPLFSILSGGLMLGAFFMATDYVTIPLTRKGRLIFALGCGALTLLFREFSSMPEGVMYSILLMNAFTPMLDRLTAKKPFGHKREHGKINLFIKKLFKKSSKNKS